MSMAVAFDSLQYVKKMVEAGMPRQQAEAQAEIMVEVIDDKLATKQDLQFEIEKIRHEIAEVKANLELKIEKVKSELIKWMLSAMVAQSAIIVSCIKFIH